MRIERHHYLFSSTYSIIRLFLTGSQLADCYTGLTVLAVVKNCPQSLNIQYKINFLCVSKRFCSMSYTPHHIYTPPRSHLSSSDPFRFCISWIITELLIVISTFGPRFFFISGQITCPLHICQKPTLSSFKASMKSYLSLAIVYVCVCRYACSLVQVRLVCW